MSNLPCFIDSNIWLYGLMTDPSADREEETRKRSIAIALTNTEGIIISTQVINEVCSVLSRKAAFNEDQLKQVVQEFYSGCLITNFNLTILLNASDLRIQYGFSFWDSLIVASALSVNATNLYSEDMQDGLIVSNSLEIKNPFRM
jgi:predicted nucleic acid-binding protein